MLNKVMLIGRLGADPKIRHMPSGDQVATINLATTRRWTDRNTNERKEETEWHRVVFFSGLAKIVGEYLKKGSQVYVEGRIRTQKWQGKDGQDKCATEIIAESMNMLGGKSESNQQNQAQASTATNPAPKNNSQPDYDYDDDIPF